VVNPVRRAALVAGASTLVATSVGAVVLFAYVLRESSWIHPGGGPAMVPNTALGIVLAGIALFARLVAGPPTTERVTRQWWRVGSVAAGCAAMILGLTTLAQYGFGVSLGVDDLLGGVSSWARAQVGATRPSPQAAFAIACIGGGATALNWRSWTARAVAHAMALGALSVALTALLGHAFGMPALYAVSPRVGMAALTAAAMTLLACGVLATPPLVGLSALVTRQSVGGVLARRVLPVILVLPVALGIGVALGQRSGLYGGPTGAALNVVTTITAILAFVAWAASVLDRADMVRAEAMVEAERERALRGELTAANEQLQEQTIQLEELALELEHQVDETRAGADRLETANAALDERERRFRSVFESDMIGIVFWGVDGAITDANDAFLRTVGYDRDDLIRGRVHWQRMTPPEWAPVDDRALHQVGVSGTSTPFEKEFVRKDGTRIRVLVGVASVVTARDRGVAFVLDIADRWVAQVALRMSERRYRLLFDANPRPMWVYDRQTLEFLAVNRAAIARYGYTRDEFRRMTIRDIRPPADVPALEAMLGTEQPALASTPPVRHRRKDGSVFEVAITADSFDFEGRPGRLVLAEDVTELRRAHAALAAAFRAAEEARTVAESANRAKSQFLAVMSHELRTPLNAILGYGDLLSMEICGPVADDQRDKLARMRSSALYLVALIGQVLDFERIEAGQEQVLAERTDISEFLRRAASDIEPQAMKKGLTLTITAPDEPVHVTTDLAKLRQIVLNLLSNAVKFTEQGEIQLSARRVDGEIEFSVRDTGMGIPPEHQEQIFDPFWQVDQRLTRTVGGAGLGLTIVQRVTQLLGGRVAVESAPGRGATFTVRLPSSPQPISRGQ
jgi:PAS domain S-box-containing protein